MMTEPNAMTRAEFDAALSIFGADLSRWPENKRLAASNLMNEDAHARRLGVESEALERVLASATPFQGSGISALADRIVAEARRTPRIAAVRSRTLASVPVKASRPGGIGAMLPRSTRGAGLLVASLLLGVFVGQSQLTIGALAAIEDVTGIVLDQQASLAQAVGEDWDED